VTAQRAEPGVEVLAGGDDGARVLGQLLLLPGVGGGAQQRHQGGRRRQVHVAGVGVLEQGRVVLERRGEEGLPGTNSTTNSGLSGSAAQ
jgi:hypothetical protein